MEWLHDKDQIEIREDGSCVVQVFMDAVWMPYHVTQEYSPNLYAEVAEFLAE